MADVEVRCNQCDAVVRISEFADIEKLSCQHCGGGLIKPQSLIAAANKPHARLTVHRSDTPSATHATAAPEEWSYNRTMELSKRLRNQDEHEPRITHHFLSWLLFLLVGTTMYFVRYHELLDSATLALMRENAFYVVFAIYIFIIIRAFADTIFQGVLCVIIPPWPFYYLFFISNNFYMRALVGGLLIGLGEDAGRTAVELSRTAYQHITDFIASGG